MDSSQPKPATPIVPEPAWSGRSAGGVCCGSCCLLFLLLALGFGFLMYRASQNGSPDAWVQSVLEAAKLSPTSTEPTVITPEPVYDQNLD